MTLHFQLLVRCVQDGEEYNLAVCEAESAEEAINNLSDILERLAIELRKREIPKD